MRSQYVLSDPRDGAAHAGRDYRGTGRLVGRRALVIAAGTPVGAAVAIAFAREGADVALAYSPDDELEVRATAILARAHGQVVARMGGDLDDPSFCHELVESSARWLGGIDAIVDAGLVPAWDVIDAASAHLPPGGTVVTTAAGRGPGAVDLYGRARHLMQRGIRANAVARGPVAPASAPAGVVIGRPAHSTEIASAYVFLTSTESAYVVATTLDVDGGLPRSGG